MLAQTVGDYKFMWMDIGTNGTDVAIFNVCQLQNYIVRSQLGFPIAEPLVLRDSAIPCLFLGDNSFTLKTLFMKSQNMNISE